MSQIWVGRMRRPAWRRLSRRSFVVVRRHSGHSISDGTLRRHSDRIRSRGYRHVALTVVDFYSGRSSLLD